ncbi:MAG: NAD(P)/FAD-dependent oxidoreductase [Candidatus Brocadiia bacterium]
MRIAVIGAGITGLTAGHELAKAGHQVTVLEKEPVPGGLMASFPFAGTQLDRVYHHIFVHSLATLELLDELGLGGEMEWGVAPSGYFHDGRVYRLASAWDLLRFRPLRPWERVRFGLSILRAQRIHDWRPLDRVTAKEWLESTCGRRVYAVMWEPLLRSKFGDAYDRVSAAWFWYKLHQRGGKRGGPERLGYLRGSYGRLADALVEAIEARGGRVALDSPMEHLAWGGGTLRVTTPRGEEVYDRVLVTAAPPVLLGAAPDLPEAYGEKLAAIEYTANLCVVMALDRPLSDIYWLNISDARFPFGGIIEHTNLIPPERYQGYHVAYLTRYLPTDDPLYAMSDAQLLESYRPFLERVAPGFDPSWVREMYVFRSDYASPVTPVGYAQRVPELASPVEGLYLATMSHIYPQDRGVDCGVILGREVAARILADASDAKSESLACTSSSGPASPA